MRELIESLTASGSQSPVSSRSENGSTGVTILSSWSSMYMSSSKSAGRSA